MITILNTSILTAYGTYEYVPVTLDQARELVQRWKYQSAVGHAATADILTLLLGVTVPAARVQYKQGAGDTALVFKLQQRLPEGTVLTTVEEIEDVGFEFGVLTRME